MTIRTIPEFEDILQPIIGGILGWTEEKINEDVRIGWELDGPPAFKITDNVIFITATPFDDPINRQQDVSAEESSPDLEVTSSSTRVMTLNVIAYGSSASLNLQTIKLAMANNESVRRELATNGIYFIPNTVEQRRLPESFQGRWWERADMQLRFNELLSDTQQQNQVDSVEVTIDKENGLSTEFTVNN